MTGAKVRLAVALAAFLGWLGYLSYAALTKDRGPVVSRAQWAAATYRVVGKVAAGSDGQPLTAVTLTEALGPAGPAANATVEVVDLKAAVRRPDEPPQPDATVFSGPGDYLLLLVKDGGKYRIADLPRSPGVEAGVGRPLIYPWTPAVAAQAGALQRAGNP